MIVLRQTILATNDKTLTIETLVRLHYDAIFHLAQSIWDDADEANDAAQDTTNSTGHLRF